MRSNINSDNSHIAFFTVCYFWIHDKGYIEISKSECKDVCMKHRSAVTGSCIRGQSADKGPGYYCICGKKESVIGDRFKVFKNLIPN